ncbi:MAG: AMP-binding protein [Ruminiclostridium sp.]|nr:AMP-binding protein [Ruminiclostridium sp.]
MAEFYTRFIKETFDESGRLIDCSYEYDESFNYGYDVIDPLGELYPDRLAMLWRNDRGEEARLTFGDVKRLSTQAANCFAARGLKKGDALMAVLRTHWEYWVVAVAAHKLGLLLSPVYYRFTADELAYRMEKANVKAVVTCREGGAAENVLAAAKKTGVGITFALGGGEGFEDFHAAIASQPETMARVATRTDEPMLVYFTSGTTGQPKAVLHNQAFPLANHYGSRYMQDVHDGSLHFATGDTGWEVVSGTKFYGQWLHLGALLVIDYDRFPPELVLETLSSCRATGMMAQPTVYRMLTDVGMDQYDLSSMTNFAVGGEKLPPDLAATVLAQTGHRLYEGYAQSECGLVAAVSKNMGRKEGAVGKVMPKYHVEILREDGTFAPPGEEGEIVLVADGGRRPEGVMMGFLGDPEATANLWDQDIFHTGDLAVMDEEGYLFYRGRSNGIIKTKGYRVSPVEIEATLAAHPAVCESLAVGVPDRDLGQRLKVYVVPVEGVAPDEALKDELLAFHNGKCAGFKKIRELEFVASLARNPNGKIIRDQFKGREG